MSELFFWKNWHKTYQTIYYALLLCLMATLIAFLYFYYAGVNFIIPWQVENEIRSIKHQLDEVNVGMFTIPIEVEMFVNEEKYQAPLIQVNLWTFQSYGFLLCFASVLLLSIITTLRLLWYGIGITIFIFFLSYLNFDLLEVVSFRNGLLLVALLMFVPISFYFNTIGKNIALHWRIMVFSLLMGVFQYWMLNFSAVKYPVLFLVSYGMLIPIILTFIYITIVSHEILRGFFQLIIQYNAQAGKSNLTHFSIITAIYLLNLILLFAFQRGYLELDLYYVDVFWLFLVSVILGIWGYKKREVLHQDILPFAPQGAFFYLIMGILSLGTMAFYFATNNDAMIDVFNDAILFSFVGFGLVFYFYILGNFTQLISQKLPVEKILYQGIVFPYGLLRYFGIVIIIGFVVLSNQYQWYQATSGFYNSIGDAYFAHQDYRMAKLNYENAYANDFLNHHTNYALASIADIEKDAPNQAAHLKTALRRYPTEQSYIRLSNELLKYERNFDALFLLQEGVKKFPNSLYLNNNIALLYAKNKIADSTFYHFQKAEKNAWNCAIPQNNLWAYLAEYANQGMRLDSLPPIIQEKSNHFGKLNKLALFNKAYKPLKLENKITTSGVDKNNFALLYNFTLNQIGQKDTTALELLHLFNQKDKKAEFAFQSQFLEACYEYKSGNVEKGIQLLVSIPTITSNAYYNTIAGLWLLEQACYGNALFYLNRAIDLGNQQAVFYKAIAMSESGDTPKALGVWQEVGKLKEQNPENIKLATKVLKVLLDSTELDNDVDRYNLIHYKKDIVPNKIIGEVFIGMQDVNLKTKAAADLILYYISENQIPNAESIYQSLQASQNVSPSIRSEINYAYLRLLIATKEFDKLLNEIDKLVLLKTQLNKKTFLKAWALEGKGDIKNAELHFNQTTKSAPFDEEVVIETARFFQEKKKDKDKAYQILVNGVRVNAFSVKMYKAYALQCLEVGLEKYGDTALDELKKYLGDKDMETFKSIYDAKKIQKEKERLGE